MTDKIIDWPAIRLDFEKGLSLRLLEIKYGASKSSIDRRSKMGQWNGTTWDKGTTPLVTPEAPIEAVQLAKKALGYLDTLCVPTMDIKEHTSFAQALTQYSKVIATAPPASEELAGFQSPDEMTMYMTPEHHAILSKLQAEVLAIKIASEQERKQA